MGQLFNIELILFSFFSGTKMDCCCSVHGSCLCQWVSKILSLSLLICGMPHMPCPWPQSNAMLSDVRRNPRAWQCGCLLFDTQCVKLHTLVFSDRTKGLIKWHKFGAPTPTPHPQKKKKKKLSKWSFITVVVTCLAKVEAGFVICVLWWFNTQIHLSLGSENFVENVL